MAEQSSKPSQGGAGADILAEDSLPSEIMRMASAFWASRQRNTLLLLAAALVVVPAALLVMPL